MMNNFNVQKLVKIIYYNVMMIAMLKNMKRWNSKLNVQQFV